MKKIKFQWDIGNKFKSVIKHGITNIEAESMFYDENLVIFSDEKHSNTEIRYICIGKSIFDRILFSSFTFRNSKIRVIGTRPANKKNKANYYDYQTRK
ncbi:MAG: BrnT family toxin [Sphingobacteriales bacterium]|nr:BrnT family toxin [Sphingobacteriales bacterium]